MRILVVEDEQRLARALKQILQEHDYQVDTVFDGADGLEYGLSDIYDLIILDVMLPIRDGFTIAKELRQQHIVKPILMLTAKDAIADKVSGLDCGADDYMTKPFAPEELLARVRALSRREAQLLPERLTFSDISFDPAASMLYCGQKEVRLNYKESEILKLLLSRPSFILPKEEIILKVWGYDSDAGDGNVEAYMSFLRRKISFIHSQVGIVAVKKQGYRLEAVRC